MIMCRGGRGIEYLFVRKNWIFSLVRRYDMMNELESVKGTRLGYVITVFPSSLLFFCRSFFLQARSRFKIGRRHH